jgi:hypothetical protein
MTKPQYSKDAEIEGMLNGFFDKHKLTPIEILHGFPIYARRSVIKKFLAHYELFLKTVNLPGDIVELGVFRGQSFMSFANFLEARNIGDRAKRVWGFENFEGFTEIKPQDGPDYGHTQKQAQGYSPAKYRAELLDAIEIFNQDRFVGWKNRVELIEGDITKTIPDFAKKNPGLRISLLHLDADLYEPTKIALENLYPLVVRGGVIVFDEYGILEWSGESKAVEEFFADKKVEIQKFDWINQPGGYIIKP